MARKSTTRYAIMALLTIQPMSGYDVRRALESIGGFWHESDGQIYPTLKKLVTEGLAVKTIEQQEGKPDRHVHTLTATGQEIVREWLRQPAEPSRLRDELLFKLFFGNLLSLQDTQQQLERYQSRMEKDLAFYTQLYETASTLLKESPDRPFRLMTIRNGMIVTQAALDWCAECLQTIQGMES